MALSYIGGKSKIGTWIRNYIPNNIETYVEPFSGMFWVFFKLNTPIFKNLKTVVYNDVNPLNVNLYLCLKNYKKFWDMTQNTPIENKELFDKCKSDLFDTEFVLDMDNPNFDIAIKYAYVLSQVWSGTNPEKSSFIDLKGKYRSKFDSFKNKLDDSKWKLYFDKITVTENMDFQEVIEKYDSSTTYFYCDPPYYSTEKYYANHDFGLETHERLANTLKATKGKFSLSYYDFTQLSEWFPKDEYKWESKEFAKAAMAKAGKVQTKGTELLIMNY